MNTSVLEKLNRDLHQPSGIRYDSYPLVLDVFIYLEYWNGLIYRVIKSIVVFPNQQEVSLCKKYIDCIE